MDACRLPQSAVPGHRAAHESVDFAAAAHSAADRQGRYRLGRGSPDRSDGGCRDHLGALEIARTLLWTYFYAIVLYALLSLIAPGGYSPMQSVLATVCEPVLRPFRRLIPSVAGLDLSPLWACIVIQAILILLH